MTPAQLAAARERSDKELEREEFSTALICYTVAKLAGAKDVKLHDWMSSKQNVHTEPEKPSIDVEAKIGALAEIFGGKIEHG